MAMAHTLSHTNQLQGAPAGGSGREPG